MVESMVWSVSQSLLRSFVESQPLNRDAFSNGLMKPIGLGFHTCSDCFHFEFLKKIFLQHQHVS